jgi:hypothetical protein
MSTSRIAKPEFENFPNELSGLRIWVLWRYEKRADKKGVVGETKVPYSAKNAKRAKSNDSDSWSTLDAAVEKFNGGGFSGVGFCLTPPYVGVDLDNCRPDGKTDEPWAAEIIRELDSYTEVSPSGHGVRVIVKGELPDGRRQREFDDRGRFLTLTGCRIGGNGSIAERTAELGRIHARLFPPETKTKAKSKADAFVGDDELIERAKKAKDGGKFARLWAGQWENDFPSQSEADASLCAKLCFWTDRDAGRIDRLFRMSGLYRDKWEREDYRQATINRAIERTTQTWKPKAYTLRVDLNLATPTLSLLNSAPLFQGRIKFAWIRRRGTLIQAGFADGSEATWPTATDLRTFSRSQDILFSSTGVLVPSPPPREVKPTWEPIAQLVRTIADSDATNVDPALPDEFAELLKSTWERANRPKTETREEFFEMLQKCQNCPRDPGAVMPPAAACWIGGSGELAEQSVWVCLNVLQAWLSTPACKSRHYPWDELRSALLMLNFQPRELHRSFGDAKVHVRVWQGPLDLLIDDDTVEDTSL